MTDSSAAAKKKVAILGGGVAAVTVALQLTEDPNWRDTFESITIYQLGWRLGGKGATGRTGDTNRILEHGLHVWLGYYENAFQLIQTVYKDAKRLPGAPLQKWEQAFTGQNYVGVNELYNGRWVPWMLELPVNNGVPGDGNVPALRDSMQELSDWIGRNAEQFCSLTRPQPCWARNWCSSPRLSATRHTPRRSSSPCHSS